MAVRRFRSDASIRVALLSVTAAGVGLDFSSASVVVFAGGAGAPGWGQGAPIRHAASRPLSWLQDCLGSQGVVSDAFFVHAAPRPSLHPPTHPPHPPPAELPDEVALVRQAEDRAHRQGQSQPVNVYFLCAKATTDDRRWQALNRSLARVAAVHDGAGLRARTPAAAKVAARCAEADGRGGGAGGADATTPGACQGGGATPQAGLLVERVYDAEAAGLTQAAAFVGQATGLRSGAQADASLVPQAGEGTAPAAAGAAAGDAAPGRSTEAADPLRPASGGTEADQAQGAADNACDHGSSPVAAAAQAAAFAAAAGAEADTPLLAPTPPGLGFTPAGAALDAPASSFVAATDEPPSPAAPASVAAPAPLAAVSPRATACAAKGSPPASASHMPRCQDGAPLAEAATFGSPMPSANMPSDAVPPAMEQPEQPAEPAEVSSPCACHAQPAAHHAPIPAVLSPRSTMVALFILPASVATPLRQQAEVWFEVSGNTGRVHLHAAPDGSAPLRLSLPMEALLAGDSPPLEELLGAVGLDSGPPSPVPAAAPPHRQHEQQAGAQPAPLAGLRATLPAASKQQQGQQHEQQALPGQVEECPRAASLGRQRRPAVVGGIGVLALDRGISAARLAAMLAEAREFAAEWRELRGLHQSRLQGQVLRPPLAEVSAGRLPGLTPCRCACLPALLPASLSCLALVVSLASTPWNFSHARLMCMPSLQTLARHGPPAQLHCSGLTASSPFPLQAVEEVDQAAAAAGRLGVSTNRFVDTRRADLALPPGAEWRPVRVAFKRCVGRGAGRAGNVEGRPTCLGSGCGMPLFRQPAAVMPTAASPAWPILLPISGAVPFPCAPGMARSASTSSPSCPTAHGSASTAPSRCPARQRRSRQMPRWTA